MAETLEVRLLGPLEVERAGRLVPVGSAKQRRLLCELAIADGAVVSIDRLVTALWDGDAPDSARNSLQSHVARLRDTLEHPDVVVTRPGGYALATGAVSTDVARFTRALASARGLVDTEPAAAVDDLARALEAWRGDALADFDDTGARAQAERLGRMHADARELLAVARMRCHDLAGALDVVEQLLLDDPLRETAVVARARCLAELGRLHEALASLRQYRDHLATQLGLDPSERISELERQLLQGGITPAGSVVDQEPPAGVGLRSVQPVRPPRLGTPTLGRSAESERIEAAMAASPLVTLVGPGGVGKTRLAADVAHRARRVAWIDLSSTSAEGDIIPAIVDGLGLATPGELGPVSVVRALGRFDGLAVLDNCEHVVDSLARLLDDVLVEDAEVRMLATSRERLDIAGEMVVPITPLAVPDPAAATREDAAVALFLERSSSAGGPPVSPNDAALVASAVDGLPLGIELAAARSVAIPVPDLLRRLEAHLDVLSGTRRRHGERHRTLSHVIAWSYDLLPEVEQALFRRLSVFAGSFQLSDVEAVCCDDTVLPEQVPGALAHLVECSMVTRTGPGEHRLLVPLRLFAGRLLEQTGEDSAVRARQRRALLALADRAASQMIGPGEVEVARAVDARLPDLRALHARTVEAGDLQTVARLTSRLYRYAYIRLRTDLMGWGAALATDTGAEVDDTERTVALAAATASAWMRGDYDAARRFLALTQNVPDDPQAAFDVEESHGDLLLALGDIEASVQALEHACRLPEQLGDEALLARAEANLSIALLIGGHAADARARAETSTRRAEASGSPSTLALALYALGEAQADTDPDDALVSLERSRRVAESCGAHMFAGVATTAEVALRGRHGDPLAALEQYADALRLWLDAGADGMVQTTLRNLVALLTRIAADADAVTVHAAIDRLATTPTFGDEERRITQAAQVARGRLGEAETARASAVAQDLGTIPEVVAVALDAIDRALRDGSPGRR